MKISKKQSAFGFSLVEVTLAMAIAAVAVVSIVGMLPQGLGTMQAASDTAIEARIHQQILNEIQMTEFDGNLTASPVDDFNGLEIYYDSQGEELGDSKSGSKSGAGDPKGSFEHVYSARITVLRDGDQAPVSVGEGSFGGVTFDENAKEVNPYIRPVIVEVAAVGGLGETFDWEEEENRSLISTYQTFIVQMGHDYSSNP